MPTNSDEVMGELSVYKKPDNSASELNALLGAKVKFGLRAQGHLPVVATMLANGRTWDEIGKAIGWDGSTAKEYWLKEIQGT